MGCGTSGLSSTSPQTSNEKEKKGKKKVSDKQGPKRRKGKKKVSRRNEARKKESVSNSNPLSIGTASRQDSKTPTIPVPIPVERASSETNANAKDLISFQPVDLNQDGAMTSVAPDITFTTASASDSKSDFESTQTQDRSQPIQPLILAKRSYKIPNRYRRMITKIVKIHQV